MKDRDVEDKEEDDTDEDDNDSSVLCREADEDDKEEVIAAKSLVVPVVVAVVGKVEVSRQEAYRESVGGERSHPCCCCSSGRLSGGWAEEATPTNPKERGCLERFRLVADVVAVLVVADAMEMVDVVARMDHTAANGSKRTRVIQQWR